MTLSKSYYVDLALKIVPPSHHRPVGQLRTMIAEVLEREVNTALAKQREQEFPDLVVSRKELANQRQELLDHQDTMGDHIGGVTQMNYPTLILLSAWYFVFYQMR